MISGSSSVDRALAFQAGGRGFEPRLPLFKHNNKRPIRLSVRTRDFRSLKSSSILLLATKSYL